MSPAGAACRGDLGPRGVREGRGRFVGQAGKMANFQGGGGLFFFVLPEGPSLACFS